jgi:hypothetical protein
MGNFFNNGAHILKLTVRVCIYHILATNVYLKTGFLNGLYCPFLFAYEAHIVLMGFPWRSTSSIPDKLHTLDSKKQ